MGLHDQLEEMQGSLNRIEDNQHSIKGNLPGCALYVLLGLTLAFSFKACYDTSVLKDDVRSIRDDMQRIEFEKRYEKDF